MNAWAGCMVRGVTGLVARGVLLAGTGR
jgi:hypothetical protein